ncbi:helix-turn-helix domain-containing protein [Tepidanaerobacter syntrophicus]|uniref:helix-turn-helix domain-containing protein n=1 Tax=Tepidanaerobacter syntrophicus TaxID=224999 RepID=UPI001BD57A72|nr:helix-turn-helix transcriptional regulator [Tepidanaerobacter syntrophicus]
MKSLKTVGERIKYARKLKGLTQNDIYKLTGISSGNLSDIENNKVLPSANALISLKRELGVSIDWILTGEADISFDKKQNKLYGDVGKLSSEEIDVLLKYRKLDDADKEEISAIIDIKLHRKNKNV